MSTFIKARRSLSFFRLHYTRGHDSLIYNPSNNMRRRMYRERETTGLFWHVTVDQNTSRTSVVRTWVRRRLRNAFREELKERGIAEDGMIQDTGARHENLSTVQALVESGVPVVLSGSIRMHALPSVVPAKYADIRKQTGRVVEALLAELENDLRDQTRNSTKKYRSKSARRPSSRIVPETQMRAKRAVAMAT